MSIISQAQNNNSGYAGHAVGGSNNTRGRKADDRPVAQVWLNVGYETEVQTEEGLQTIFTPTPVGIALDTMQPADERVNSSDFAMKRQASNALLRKLQDAAKTLEPGEARIVNLKVELRRVADKAVADEATNPLIQEVDLFAV